MPRELITVQVGQCGNQIGCRFWEQALKEHALHNPDGIYDDALSSFFKNVDERSNPPQSLPVGSGSERAKSLKARAVVVDMEEGVINNMLASPLGRLFDARSMLNDVSGAGNNWAHGFHHYGPLYRDHILERVRGEAEQCDSLQGFLLLHSLGGGTGSGLGSYLLGALADTYPEIARLTVSLFPSEDDDVITSPYNAMLALDALIEHASATLPIENQALLDIVSRVEGQVSRKNGRASDGDATSLLGEGAHQKKPYDAINSLAANALLHLTAGMRFEGALNVDMSDVTMNMVPYPRLHFLATAMSPLSISKGAARGAGAGAAQHRAIDRLFHDVMGRQHQLMACHPRQSMYLACGLLTRGDVTAADVSRNVSTLKANITMPFWNREGFKVGLCDKAPVGAPHGLLALSNNTCVADTFGVMRVRFQKLFRRQVYVHHYHEYMDKQGMSEAYDNVGALQDAYHEVQNMPEPDYVERYVAGGTSFV